MYHDYITSSDISFGDIVFNNCDPDQFQISYCDQDTIAIVYRVIAYLYMQNELLSLADICYLLDRHLMQLRL